MSQPSKMPYISAKTVQNLIFLDMKLVSKLRKSRYEPTFVRYEFFFKREVLSVNF